MSVFRRRLTAYFPHLALAVLLLSLALSSLSPLGRVDLCATHRMTGLPCPGCGVTRAIVRCSHGQWSSAWEAHPLGPLVWAAALACASALLWPRRWKESYSAWCMTHHRLLDWALWGFVGLLMLFWVARLAFIWLAPPPGWTWSEGYELRLRP